MGTLADPQAVTAFLARIYKRPPQMVRVVMLCIIVVEMRNNIQIAVGGFTCFSLSKTLPSQWIPRISFWRQIKKP